MARIPYPDVQDEEVARLVEQVRDARDGRLPMLFLMHMHSAAIFEAWLAMGTALRYRTSLDDRSRELAICMVARLLDYDYQYDSHAPIAIGVGLSSRAVKLLPSWEDVDDYSERDRVVLAYTEAVTHAADVPDELFERVRASFEASQIVELTATIAFYGCGARFLKALEIRADDEQHVASRLTAGDQTA